jgi:hypothetical protein
LVCIRPAGIEKYEAHFADGSGYCGVYDTRTVRWYIKSGTWVILESDEYFLNHDIAELQDKLKAKQLELTEL